MSGTAIRVQNVWKRFEIGELVTMKDLVRLPGRTLKWPLRRFGLLPQEDRSQRELWALNDVSFEVRAGESLGIIGGNGAGKSTLLKLLSRITAPTRGRIELHGRVASLLEVGTGMHPELTGRENVYLNGAILGMSRSEVRSKFDEILEFAGVERFIDTPIKRYSSGMRVRLGFAVAAHLEPEILIVDEVLAVGDAQFQRKCLGKMGDVARGGRTVLFVSHNMGSIQTLCNRVIVLREGRIAADAPPSEAIKCYVQTTLGRDGTDVASRTDRRGLGGTKIVGMSVYTEGHEDVPGVLIYGHKAVIRCEISELLPDLACEFTILNNVTQRLCRFASRVATPSDAVVDGRCFTCEIPEMPIIPGRYQVNVTIRSAGGEVEDSVDGAISFDVEYGTLDCRPLAKEQTGVLFAPRHRWVIPRMQR